MGVRTRGFTGRTHTAEARARMRQSALRRCADPEIKAAWSRIAARRYWFKEQPSTLIHSKGDTAT